MNCPAMAGEYAVVVGGGDISERLLPLVESASLVVAADSGAEFLSSHGISIDVLVGDFDSCDPEVVARAGKSGCRVITLPVRKDITDSEAALDVVMDEGYKAALVLGALGGERVEHGIANLFLVERYARRGLDVVLASPKTRVSHVSGPGYAGVSERVLAGDGGDWVSLFPVTENVEGVTTCNLEYPLCGAILERGLTLGVSNKMTDKEASVSVTGGFLLIVHTGK